MRRIDRIQLIRALLAGACLHFSAGSPAQQPADAHVVPLSKATVQAMDKRIEAIRGDRKKSDEPFVIRIHAEAGYIIMPHTHPVDENIVVVEGSWALGMGDRFEKKRLEPMEVGDFGFAAKGMAHFAWSKTATILQVHGIGPFLVKWVNPVYEFTNHGVVVKATAEDPGRPVSPAPAGCFAMALGARVRSNSYGDGIVMGAQCTPGELTQYRVEKQDGERYWAQREELQAF
jgi:quercetin dioxygenase-like cupin family protein